MVVTKLLKQLMMRLLKKLLTMKDFLKNVPKTARRTVTNQKVIKLIATQQNVIQHHVMLTVQCVVKVIIAKMVKQIKETGCNVLLIQKSTLRDAVTDLSLEFCAKAKILANKKEAQKKRAAKGGLSSERRDYLASVVDL